MQIWANWAKRTDPEVLAGEKGRLDLRRKTTRLDQKYLAAKLSLDVIGDEDTFVPNEKI